MYLNFRLPLKAKNNCKNQKFKRYKGPNRKNAFNYKILKIKIKLFFL